MKKCLEWCLELGIKTVSVFAFSIENFNRDQDEINYIMDLFFDTLEDMAVESDFLAFNEVKIKVVGNLDLLPERLSDQIDKVEQLTNNYKKLTCNICFAYNSSYEIERVYKEKDKCDNKNVINVE